MTRSPITDRDIATSRSAAQIDSEWLYRGDDNYQGLLKENDLTKEAFKRGDEIKDWIGKAQAVVRQDSEPQVSEFMWLPSKRVDGDTFCETMPRPTPFILGVSEPDAARN